MKDLRDWRSENFSIFTQSFQFSTYGKVTFIRIGKDRVIVPCSRGNESGIKRVEHADTNQRSERQKEWQQKCGDWIPN